jgi:hypothetical protein
MGRTGRMFWRGGGETPEEGVGEISEEHSGPIHIERGAPRPATILRVAGELEARGGTIVELFKEVDSPLGRVVMPIHFRQDDQDFLVEIATEPWNGRRSREAVDRAAIVRNSDYAGAGLEILSAYPVPTEVEFFFGMSPAAMLQLDLARLTPDMPEVAAGVFREVASEHWGVDLNYEPVYLPLVEELLLAVLDADEDESPPPLSDGLVAGLGCFLGETIRRNVNPPGAWRPPEKWGGGPVVELKDFVLDPVGKARAFLEYGPQESITFYVQYTLELLGGEPEDGVSDPRSA